MSSNQNIEEEIFCLNFELSALSDLLIRGHAERWLYKFMLPEIENEHLERYLHALPFARGKRVLDIACGCGYGAYLMAEKGMASEVAGIDLSADSIRYGNHRYAHKSVSRSIGNAEEFSVAQPFDVILSFETIEHLNNPEAFLKNVRKALSPDGKFLISTPVVPVTQTSCNNPFHMIEWNFTDFHKLLSSYFKIDRILLQSVDLKTEPVSLGQRVSNRLRRQFAGPASRPQPNAAPKYKLTDSKDFNLDDVLFGYQVVECRLA